MRPFGCFACALACILLGITAEAAPTIDPIPAVTIPAGKSLILPVTATSPSGQPLKYTVTSDTNGIAVVLHTNNPFWQLTVAQAAATNAPGAYKTPFRGGLVSVTNVGAMTFMLFPEYAPHTVNVFQGLTSAGFYTSNTIFHRVVTNFVIQGGDPLTNGTGGLVFYYNDEFNPQAVFAGNGQLALPNGGKNTNGSQFFVTVGPQRGLDFRFTIFGQLVRGFPTLTNINSTPVDGNSRPLADEIIQLAAYVSNTTDTVLTLTATNVAGTTGHVTVIADDGAGGRATNTFTASVAADTNSNHNPFIQPNNFLTNLVVPVNQTLTNYISALELDGDMLYWTLGWTPQGVTNFSANYFNSNLRTLTYNVTNVDGQLQFFIAPTNYVGPVNVTFVVDANSSPYDEQSWTFVFGDTPIAGQTNAFTVLAGTEFTNALMATFTNGVPGSAATNFTASINWGDNTITSGRIGTNGAAQKTVLGAHTYTYPGVYPVYVQVQSTIGASATILSWITVISTAPKLSPGATPALGANGFNFNLQQLVSGMNVVVQVSTNLTNWSTLTNFTATNSTLSFRDPAATGSGRRFYRAMVP